MPRSSFVIATLVVVALAPIARGDDASAILRASFASEDLARATDVVSYEGPSYEGCCPVAIDDANGANKEMLACCALGGCCPSAETTDAYGVHLACCSTKRGSVEENRAKSRVWYSGPSYDGCCPNGDGNNAACCASERGCCPTSGERRACCPELMREVGFAIDRAVDIEDMRASANEVDDDGQRYDSKGIANGRYERGFGEAFASEKTSEVDDMNESDADTVYLQLAAVLCVVVWAAALISNTMYAKLDGRDGGEGEGETLLVGGRRNR